MDANDIIWRNNAMAAYDVPSNLPKVKVKVKAKVLVVGVVEDKVFPPKEASQPIADAIPGARLLLDESPLGHLGSAVHLGKANEAIVKIIAEAEMGWRHEAGVSRAAGGVPEAAAAATGRGAGAESVPRPAAPVPRGRRGAGRRRTGRRASGARTFEANVPPGAQDGQCRGSPRSHDLQMTAVMGRCPMSQCPSATTPGAAARFARSPVQSVTSIATTVTAIAPVAIQPSQRRRGPIT